MNIIIVNSDGNSKNYTLSYWARMSLFGLLLVMPFGMGALGYWLIQQFANDEILDHQTAKVWQQTLSQQRQQLNLIKQATNQELSGLTVRLAELQSRLMRLDALGEHLMDVAELPEDEFDFSQRPALGGPSGEWEQSYSVTTIDKALEELSQKIADREQQLQVLDDLMSASKTTSSTFVAGRPISRGWMSSRYGKRTDPFTGRIAWHAGVDFAGKLGSNIIAVASGVVTWSDKRYGYGRMIEINHGNGYKTRYAHCQTLNVKVGDVVRKGDIIAAMGSSGRSTGPHVHFEVYKNGRTVDPAAYIHRKPR